MQHFTCDLCGQEIRPGDALRYVLRIEVYAARDPAELTEEDLDDDHLEAVGQQIREIEEGLSSPELDDPHKKFRFDLCPNCRKKYVRDPLSKDISQKFDFSEN
jgi:hypothetical protein